MARLRVISADLSSSVAGYTLQEGPSAGRASLTEVLRPSWLPALLRASGILADAPGLCALRHVMRFVTAVTAAVLAGFVCSAAASFSPGDSTALVALFTTFSGSMLASCNLVVHVNLGRLMDNGALDVLLADELPEAGMARMERTGRRVGRTFLGCGSVALAVWIWGAAGSKIAWDDNAGLVVLTWVVSLASAAGGVLTVGAALAYLYVSLALLREHVRALCAGVEHGRLGAPDDVLSAYLRLCGHIRAQARQQQLHIASIVACCLLVSANLAVFVLLASGDFDLMREGYSLYVFFALLLPTIAVAVAGLNDSFDDIVRALSVHRAFSPEERSALRADLHAARTDFAIYGVAVDSSLVFAGAFGLITSVVSFGVGQA